VVERSSTEVARGAHADLRHGPPPPRRRDVTDKTPPGRGFSDPAELTPPEDGRAAAPKRGIRSRAANALRSPNDSVSCYEATLRRASGFAAIQASGKSSSGRSVERVGSRSRMSLR